jgi:glycosyltransferase involved in cell wall biosynthesis
MYDIDVSIILPNFNSGGAERLHITLANTWRSLGYNVEFVLLNSEGNIGHLLKPDINVVHLNVSSIKSATLPLANYIRCRNPKVILAAMWPLTTVSILAWKLSRSKSKCFVSDHTQLSVSARNELSISPFLLYAAINFSYPFCSGVIAVSEGVKSDIIRYSIIKPQKIRVIYNPAALNRLSNRLDEAQRNQMWGPRNRTNLLSVGTLKEQKDHATLIHAVKILIEDGIPVVLTIIGDGPLRSTLANLIVELDLTGKVRLAGYVSDPLPWYQTADVFVLSSRWEGFGNVIVEALEAGLPVVSTDCPSGPSEILENGKFGILVPPENPIALADAIRTLINNPGDPLKRKARALSFSSDTIAKQYLSYFGLASDVTQ